MILHFNRVRRTCDTQHSIMHTIPPNASHHSYTPFGRAIIHSNYSIEKSNRPKHVSQCVRSRECNVVYIYYAIYMYMFMRVHVSAIIHTNVERVSPSHNQVTQPNNRTELCIYIYISSYTNVIISDLSVIMQTSSFQLTHSII